MNYTPENIDIPAFEKALQQERNFQQSKLLTARKEAEAYFHGYEDCIDHVSGMLHCDNYEDTKKNLAHFVAGADTAFYEICKELDVSSQDVREMDTSIDEKAALLAERIRMVLLDNGTEAEDGEPGGADN